MRPKIIPYFNGQWRQAKSNEKQISNFKIQVSFPVDKVNYVCCKTVIQCRWIFIDFVPQFLKYF